MEIVMTGTAYFNGSEGRKVEFKEVEKFSEYKVFVQAIGRTNSELGDVSVDEASNAGFTVINTGAFRGMFEYVVFA